MSRHMTAITLDLVIDFPEGMERDTTKPEVQKFLRESFIDYLESAEHIDLYFDIDEEEEE